MNISTPFITLGQLLKFSGIVASGSDAKEFLVRSRIAVNSISENRRGRKLYPGDMMNVQGQDYLIVNQKDGADHG